MSVSKFREFVEKSGCGWIVAIALAAVMVLGILQCNPAVREQLDASTGQGEELANIQGVSLRANYVNQFAQQTREQMAQGRSLTPEEEIQAEGHGLEQSVIACMLLVLCEREGIKLDFDTLKGALDKQANEQIEAQRLAWINEGKLKATASKEEFNNLFKTTYGRTPDEVIEANRTDLKSRLANDEAAFTTKVNYANTILIDHYGKKMASSEADVRASYDTYNTKRIQLKKSLHPGEDLVKKLNDIKKEIQSGSITFEQAMVKYSDEPGGTDPKDPKKTMPKSESVMQIDGTTIQIDDSYIPVSKLKKGEISAPLGFADSVEIFRLDSITNNAPADLKDKLETYREQYVAPRAITKMQNELKALRADKSLISWKSKGHELLYERQTFINDPANFSVDPATQRKKFEDLLDRAEKVAASNDPGARIASMLTYVLMEDIFARTEVKDRGPLEDRRIAILERMSNDMGDSRISAKLVTTLIAKKDKDRLPLAFEKAIRDNLILLDEAGAAIFAQLSTDVDQALEQKLITEEQAKTYKQGLNDWKVAKIADDKIQAEAKKAAEEQKKIDEANEKKRMEDLKKEEEKIKKEAEAENKKNATPEKTKTGG